jgi:hypothetical protein
MVRKRKKQEEELIWCFFCERTFKVGIFAINRLAS